MITRELAEQIIQDNSKALNSFKIDLNKCQNQILATNVISAICMPPFRQSAMDGYAIAEHNTNSYILIGEIQAGGCEKFTLKKGEAVRIFTGAPVPDTANAVIMQEKVITNGDTIEIQDDVKNELNIRAKGEQIKTGEVALEKGTKLTPAAIGYLASLGVTEVEIHKSPKISVVATGNELIAPGNTLEHGQIYESNSIMLAKTLNNLGFTDITTYKVEDNYSKTYDCLKNVINTSDLVLVSGGISVGDYDFVGKALEEIGVEKLFYKVKQKPGKPLFFGKKKETLVFALPGNPAATLSCFYIYVRQALAFLSGDTNYQLPQSHKKSLSDFNKKGDRPQFLKAIVNGDNVKLLEGQSSSMLQTFALSNALVFIPEDITNVKKGDFVEVISIL